MNQANIIIFDLDGTLIDVFSYHRKCLDDVVQKIWNVKGRPRGVEVSGIPQTKTIENICLAQGISKEKINKHINEAQSMLSTEMSQSLPLDLSDYLLPGAVSILEKLSNTHGFFLGLVTGTLGPTANVILERSGIDHFLSVGAFGHEAEERKRLVWLALRRICDRFSLQGHTLSVTTIGDAPADIKAGRAWGARTVGVATGHANTRELSKYSPDIIFEDLSNTQEVYMTLLSVNNRW